MASALDHRFILRIHPNVSVTKPSGCRFRNKCVFTHKEADDQFSKKPRKQKDEGAVLEEHTTSRQNSENKIHRWVWSSAPVFGC